MAQTRTRKDKERAKKIRSQEAAQEESPSNTFSLAQTQSMRQESRSSSLLKVDQQYILKDLVKTIVISSILLIVVIGIYFYLRYN